MRMFNDIMASFFRLPRWVQVWMFLWLVPVNLVSLWFWNETAPVSGMWVAVLANLGMAANLPIMIATRGMGKAMSLPHLVFWTPLVVMLGFGLVAGDGPTAYRNYLAILWVTNVVSLSFDYKDALEWWRGARDVA